MLKTDRLTGGTNQEACTDVHEEIERVTETQGRGSIPYNCCTWISGVKTRRRIEEGL